MSKKKKETLDNISPKKKIDSDSYHEYLERAHLGGVIIESVLAEHSVYELHPYIKKEVDQILEKIADLYGVTGYLMDIKLTKEENLDNQIRRER